MGNAARAANALTSSAALVRWGIGSLFPVVVLRIAYAAVFRVAISQLCGMRRLPSSQQQDPGVNHQVAP